MKNKTINMVRANSAPERPRPFGLYGGLVLVGAGLLYAFPLFFFFCYAQATFFYFLEAFEHSAITARTLEFYRLYHFAILLNLPLSLFAGVAVLGGAKFARRVANVVLAISILSHLFLLMSIPNAINETVPDWPMRPSHLVLGLYALLAVLALLYLNLSKRCENTYDRFNGFSVRRRRPSWSFIIAAALWTLFAMGLWLIPLFVFLERYVGRG